MLQKSSLIVIIMFALKRCDNGDQRPFLCCLICRYLRCKQTWNLYFVLQQIGSPLHIMYLSASKAMYSTLRVYWCKHASRIYYSYCCATHIYTDTQGIIFAPHNFRQFGNEQNDRNIVRLIAHTIIIE